MAALTTSEIKIDGQILSRIPVLIGQSNYSIWHVKIRNTLSTYRAWEIVEGTNNGRSKAVHGYQHFPVEGSTRGNHEQYCRGRMSCKRDLLDRWLERVVKRSKGGKLLY